MPRIGNISEFGEDIFKFKALNFELNKSSLSEILKDDLMYWSEILKQYSAMKVDIRGYCDSLEKNKEKLSEERAQGVYDFLIRNGIDKSRLTIKSLSDTEPAVDFSKKQSDEEIHKKNRRVQIIITAL